MHLIISWCCNAWKTFSLESPRWCLSTISKPMLVWTVSLSPSNPQMSYYSKAFWSFTTKKWEIYSIWSCSLTRMQTHAWPDEVRFPKKPDFQSCTYCRQVERITGFFSSKVLRDIEERGRDLENVLFQYTNLVKPAFEEFCLPTKKHADVIIPRGADNAG